MAGKSYKTKLILFSTQVAVEVGAELSLAIRAPHPARYETGVNTGKINN